MWSVGLRGRGEVDVVSAHPVLVVGAGPVGLAAALALRARGLPATVVEAEPEARPRPGSRAIFVHRESLELLERVRPGLGWELAAEGLVWSTKRTFWGDREVYARTYPPGDPSVLPHSTNLPQVATERLLQDACKAAGVEFLWDAAVTGVAVTPDGVELTTAPGDRLQAPYVIGADGARSAVRREIGVTMEGSRSRNSFVIVDVEECADGPLPRPGALGVDLPVPPGGRLRPGGPAAARPAGGGGGAPVRPLRRPRHELRLRRRQRGRRGDRGRAGRGGPAQRRGGGRRVRLPAAGGRGLQPRRRRGRARPHAGPRPADQDQAPPGRGAGQGVQASRGLAGLGAVRAQRRTSRPAERPLLNAVGEPARLPDGLPAISRPGGPAGAAPSPDPGGVAGGRAMGGNGHGRRRARASRGGRGARRGWRRARSRPCHRAHETTLSESKRTLSRGEGAPSASRRRQRRCRRPRSRRRAPRPPAARSPAPARRRRGPARAPRPAW